MPDYERPAKPPPSYQQEPQYNPYEQKPFDNQGFAQQQHEQDPELGQNQEKWNNRPPMPTPGNTFEDTFKLENPVYHDIPFTILFIATCAGFLVVAGISLKSYHSHTSYSGTSIYGTNSLTLNGNTLILLAFVIVMGLVLALLGMVLAYTYPKQFIIFALFVNVILGLGTSILYLCLHYYSAGIVFLVLTCLSAWFYWMSRHRIPFSAQVLQIVIGVVRVHPYTWIVSLIGALVSGAFAALFSATIVATYLKWNQNDSNPNCQSGSCSSAKVKGILVFVFFAGYYISEVIRNVIHVTVSGIYGTWYYMSKSDQGMPKYPALGAFKRAMTYSFGSICFGSLIVSLIQLLQTGLRILKQDALNSGETCGAIAVTVIQCIVWILNWLVSYFNHYAYSYVALYGKSYLDSAKDTWHFMKYKGIDALVNDMLINPALTLYSLFVAYFSALLAYLFLRFTKPAYNSDGGYYAPVVAFSFLIGMQLSNIMNSVIRSGTATFFIALAKDPEVFQMSYPQEFEEVFRNYPQVLQKLQQ
ncbi:unnamed protein product [Kuraishia capsulata CBS 1993]|uniref:Protein PNS1 n=1 Tax=Kuraishia capsulata CBS 1993 TaxID=1382522 RepID=W6MMB2_9ASCO|nr:uncharacterized protein KUCA_T00003655001 [Kuraishia capsulata CBS 1993]CDK27676.1 unnamed protein product [Kuraishia capsulata CBS 1993]